MEKPKQYFEKMQIRRKEFNPDAQKTYRVYKDAGNFVISKGKTASEALKDSAVENAYRVVLHDLLDETVLEGGTLNDYKTAAPAAAPAEPEPEVAAAAPAEAEAEKPA